MYYSRYKGQVLVLTRFNYKVSMFIGNQIACEGMYFRKDYSWANYSKPNVGSIILMKNMPEGLPCCSIYTSSNSKSRAISVSPGCYSIVVNHSGSKKALIRLPSGKRTVINSNSTVNIGIISTGGKTGKPLLKASISLSKKIFKKQIRVRCVAKNPVDHPHGGGNRQHIGHPSTVSRRKSRGSKVGLISARRSGIKK